MPVNITLIENYNRFRDEPVNFLLANDGDVIVQQITFQSLTAAVSSKKAPMILNSSDGFIGDNWLKDPKGQFKDFIIGDTVMYHAKGNPPGHNQIFTIIDKKSNSAIQLSGPIIDSTGATPLPKEYKRDDMVLSVTTPITALRYKWNFIENNEPPTFKSKISGTEQELVVKVIAADDPTPIDMIFLGEKSYQMGYATAKGVSIIGADIMDNTEAYISTFQITHFTVITPYMLAAQRQALLDGTAPDYFFNAKCLKGIYDIKTSVAYTNPNWIQQDTVTDIFGNTGWRNENFNTGITNYSQSVVLKNANGDVIEAVSLTTEDTDFEITIENTVDSPFLDNKTKFEVLMTKVAFDQSEYQLNGRTADENFINDRAFNTVGSAAINGDQFGVATRQVFKNVQGVFVNTSKIKITGKVSLLAGSASVFAESKIPSYDFTVAIQDHRLKSVDADLVRLTVSCAPFFIDISDPGLVKFDHLWYKNPESGLDAEGSKEICVFPEDEIVSYSQFYVDKLGRETDIIKIDSIICKIKAKNQLTGSEFALDNFVQSFTGLPYINNNQYVDLTIDRPFLIPEEEIRKPIKIRRRNDLDISSRAYYNVSFPFLSRWEYWIALLINDKAKDPFFDQSQPNNGINQDWYHYSQLINWNCYFELTVIASKNGIPGPFKMEAPFTMFDYDSNPDWEPNTIKSYGLDMLELNSGGNKYLLSGEDTLIEAEFTKISAVPELDKIVVNMHIEVFEEGGQEGSRRMNSKWPTDGDTWFKATDGGDKIVLTLDGNTIKASVLIDGSKIPSDKAKFKIAARLYDGGIPCDCGDGFVNVDGDCEDAAPLVGFLQDYSGNGNNGDLANASDLQFVAGPFGTDNSAFLQTGGTDFKAVVGDKYPINAIGIGFEFDIRIENDGISTYVLFGRHVDPVTNPFYRCRLEGNTGDNSISFQWGDGLGNGDAGATPSLPVNANYKIAIVIDTANNTFSMYVDYTRVVYVINPVVVGIAISNPFQIFSNDGGALGKDIYFDNLKIFDGPPFDPNMATYSPSDIPEATAGYYKFEGDSVIKPSFPCDCRCDEGFAFDTDSGQCKSITARSYVCDTVDPIFNGSAYTIAKALTNVAYGNLGARFYDPDNITIEATVNTVGTIWNIGDGAKGRINLAGIWTTDTSVPDKKPVNEWVGFSQCLPDFAEDTTLFVAIAGDNHYRFKVNGVTIVTTSGTGAPSVNFNYAHVFEITFKAGSNTIEVEGLNTAGFASFYCEIFNETRAALKIATDINALNVVFSTLDKIGGTFDIGDTVGYSCPPLYALNTCGTPICKKYCNDFPIVPCGGADCNCFNSINQYQINLSDAITTFLQS